MYHPKWFINTGIPVAVVATYGTTHTQFVLGLCLEALGVIGVILAFRLRRQRSRKFDA